MKKSHIIAIIVVAIALGVIISTFTNTTTYSDFKEATASPGKEFHIIGKLVRNKPIVYDTKVNANLFTFFMTDRNGLEKKVVYQNSKPQDFEKSDQVVISGKMLGDSFVSSNMLLKCPSKYNDDKKPSKFGEKEFSSNKKP